MSQSKHLKVDVAIIGAGTAGLAARRAVLAEGKTALMIDGGPLGTTCARVGCMPSKLLIAAADAARAVRDAGAFGVGVPAPVIDGRAVMHRVRSERDRFVGFVVESVEGLPEGAFLRGYATFVDDHTLQVGETTVEAGSVIIATGSSPKVLPFLAAMGDRMIGNSALFDWDDLPESVVVFGPGVIGLEMGLALADLGVRVRILGASGSVGPLTDPTVLEYATAAFNKTAPLLPKAKVHGVERVESGVEVTFDDADGVRQVERFDFVLSAIGRVPNVGRLGLENTSVERGPRGELVVDPETLQLGESSIFLAGDANTDRPLLHEAADEGKIAGRNAALFPTIVRGTRRAPIGVAFCHPQIAMVGARFADLDDPAIGTVSFENQGRSRVMRINEGILRVYVDRQTARFLGAEMVGPRAEHLAHLMAWSVQQALTVHQMLEMPFYHPVIEEGLRTALRDAARQL